MRVSGASGSRGGSALARVLVALLLLAFLSVVAVPNFGDPQEKSKAARAYADQWSLRIAIESYRVDHGAPPLAIVPDWSTTKLSNKLRAPFAVVEAASTTRGDPKDRAGTRLHLSRPTFAISGVAPGEPGGFASLTTPIQYITSYFNDPFSPGGRFGFSYLPDGDGWLLASFDVADGRGGSKPRLSAIAESMRAQFLGRRETPYSGSDPAGSLRLLRVSSWRDGRAFAYDPTNGWRSDGAVFVVGPPNP